MFAQTHVRLRSPVTIAGKSGFFRRPARTLAHELKIPQRRISLYCRVLPRIRHNPISRCGATAIQLSWISRDVALGAKKKIGKVHVKLAWSRKRWAKKNAAVNYTHIPRIQNMVVIRKQVVEVHYPRQTHCLFHASFKFALVHEDKYIYLRERERDFSHPLNPFRFLAFAFSFQAFSFSRASRCDFTHNQSRDKGKNLRQKFLCAYSILSLMTVACCCRIRNRSTIVRPAGATQMCRRIMKFAGKICKADVSNVTRSVPSFYANKSGGRLISPWCSDAAVAIAVNINIGVGGGIGVGVDGQDDAWRQPEIRFQPGLRHSELRGNGYIDDVWC